MYKFPMPVAIPVSVSATGVVTPLPPPHLARLTPSVLPTHVEPVDLWDVLGTPPLPTGLLPNAIEQYATQMSEHTGACVSGFAMAALTVCAAAIPDRIKIQVKKHGPKWLESPRLWVMLIGLPSSRKSPILNYATLPITKLDWNLLKKWQIEHDLWSKLSKEDRAQQPEPFKKRLRIEDTTVEAAQEVLKTNSDGILCCHDEMSGFFGAMEKYSSAKGSSADRAFWLRTHAGGTYALDRISRGSTLIENASVSLLGGIQPDPLRKIASDSVDDGLLQRICPIWISPAKEGMDCPMPLVQDCYDLTIQMLRGLSLNCESLRFDDQAQILRNQLEREHLQLSSIEIFSSQFGTHIAKWDGLFARLCVLWHCIENCGSATLPGVVTYQTAWRVSQFMHKFLLRHVACFYQNLGLANDHDKLKAIAGYILAHGCDKISVRDLQRGTRSVKKLGSAHMLPLFQQLTALNWLSQEPGPRPSSDPIFIVNSRVHELFAIRREQEKNRIALAKEQMAKIFSKL